MRSPCTSWQEREGAGSEGRQLHPWPRLQGLAIHEQLTCYPVILTEHGDWEDVRAQVTLGQNESRGNTGTNQAQLLRLMNRCVPLRSQKEMSFHTDHRRRCPSIKITGGDVPPYFK